MGRESRRLSNANYAYERGAELDSESINTDLNPSPCPLPQGARGKIISVGDMKESNLSDKVFSRFTSHFSLNLIVLTPYCLKNSTYFSNLL